MKNIACSTVLFGFLAIGSVAHAQGIMGGIFSALPTVINGVTNKVMGKDPASIKGVDRDEMERNFEAQTRNMTPEQKAAMRVRFEQAIGAANGSIGLQRAAAKQAQEAPLFDTGAVLGSFIGGVAQSQIMWGQVGAASGMSRAGLSNGAIGSVLGTATMPDGGSVSAAGSGAPSSVNNPIGNAVGGLFNRIVGGDKSDGGYNPSTFLDVDVREGTKDQIDAALTKRGILATGAEPEIANIALLLVNPKVDSHPAKVKIGFDPTTNKIALLSREYEQDGEKRFEQISKEMLNAYGQPTSQTSDNGVLKYEWKIGEGEGYVLSRVNQAVAIAYQNGPRYKLMADAWNQATQKSSTRSTKR
jgi:hypothetical protein